MERKSPRAWGEEGREQALRNPPPSACPASPPPRPNAAPLGFSAPCQHLTRVSARGFQKRPFFSSFSSSLGCGRKVWGLCRWGAGKLGNPPPSWVREDGESWVLFFLKPLGGLDLEVSERVAAGICMVFYTIFSALVSSRRLWLFIVFSCYIYV